MSILDKLQRELTPIHKIGWRFIATAIAITILLWWVGAILFSVLCLFVTIYLVLIFRRAPRMVPSSLNEFVAPCDGYVTTVEKRNPPHELGLAGDPLTCISMVLGKCDSIIMRAPAAGRIENLCTSPGQGLPSLFGSAQGEREKLFMAIGNHDEKLGLVVNAGWLPNQVFKLVQEGENLFLGQDVALLAPLSSVDIYVPSQSQVQVGAGMRLVAGETVLAHVGVTPSPRQFIKV